MSNKEEFSKGGSQIHRYEPDQLTEVYDELGESALSEIDSHIQKHVGKPETVLHEIISPNVHVDIHIIDPTHKRDYYTLVTSGMSDKPMNSPFTGLEYAEIMICLPPAWKLTEEDFKDEQNYWVVRWMKLLARFPHEYNTWFWATHTIPNGDPPLPFADNTLLSCALLAYPILFPPEFCTLKIREDKEINFFCFIPIFKEEMDFKLEFGIDKLYRKFTAAGVSELLNINRKNRCERQ